MKIAIVHDQLAEFGGAERFLLSLKKIFTTADVFTLIYNPQKLGSFKKIIKNWSVKVSWFGKIPLLKNFYSPFRFLTPLIWETFDFSDYDLVISSSGSWMAKGIKTQKPTIHIAYIHHPPRYLYGYETAIEWQKYFPVKMYAYFINHFLRIWDYYSSQRPQLLIVNSQETRRRIEKFYRRKATIIYPPVKIPKNINYRLPVDNFFLTVSRLTKAKHIEVLIKAANKMKFHLKIVGNGRDEKYLKSIASNKVEFLNHLSDNQLKKLYKKAKAFLFAGVDEEFGIALVEALGYGLPVIAYNSGGVIEYLKDGINGFIFNYLNEDSLIEKINQLKNLTNYQYLTMKKKARKTAEKFSETNFKKNILKLIKKTVNKLN